MSRPAVRKASNPEYAAVPAAEASAARLPGYDVVDMNFSEDGTFRNLVVRDDRKTFEIIQDGRVNFTVLPKNAHASRHGFSHTDTGTIWCLGTMLAVVVISAIFSIVAAGYVISSGGVLEIMASRTQAFDINLISQIMHTVYPQMAQLEAQRYELYETQTLCLARLQCERYNLAYFAHFGVELNCDYSLATFESACPVDPGMFTPLTFFGLNYTISGSDVRSVFNHRSSSSNNFDRELDTLESRAAPPSVDQDRHHHHNNHNNQQNYYELDISVKSQD